MKEEELDCCEHSLTLGGILVLQMGLGMLFP